MNWGPINMGTRAQQKTERNQQILAAALDLFVENGYTGTKITDIAQKVDMSTGLLFHYYESKEALYLALMDIATQGAQNAKQIEVDIAQPLLFFEEVAKGVLQALQESSFYSKLFLLMSAATRPGVPEPIRQKALQVDNIQACVPLIAAGQAAGTIRQGDALSLSFAFWASIQGVAENCALYPGMPLPSPEWFVDMFKNHD